MDIFSSLGIDRQKKQREIYTRLPNSSLVEHTIRNGSGKLAKDGALVVLTGKHTGRSANDKYIVRSKKTDKKIWWENNIHPMTPESFAEIKKYVLDYFNRDSQDLYLSERSVGHEKEYSIGVQLISTNPGHVLFANYLFKEQHQYPPKYHEHFLILHAPDLKIKAKEMGTRSETVITTCFDTNTTIICGTLYAGEIKKSMFSVMNYVLPEKKILPMHSGASMLSNEDTTVFFGLSGTGKTTLATDKDSLLIGDDEHGLSANGIFNFEGGCYAKTYKLSKETEPSIYNASLRFGAILENIVLNEKTGMPDFFDKSISENGRSSYPLSFISNIVKDSRGNIPKHMFFLSADAFGVLPPVAKLNRVQAMFYFVLGYTSKLAGTEIGVVEPQATFSSCFGAPFMLRPPHVYAELLGHYLEKYKIQIWLINTGWTSGPYGQGHRFPLHITREIIRAVQHNELETASFEKEDFFGLEIPHHVREVPSSMLNPRNSWEKGTQYDLQAKKLAVSFHNQIREKFKDFYKKYKEGGPVYNK